MLVWHTGRITRALWVKVIEVTLNNRCVMTTPERGSTPMHCGTGMQATEASWEVFIEWWTPRSQLLALHIIFRQYCRCHLPFGTAYDHKSLINSPTFQQASHIINFQDGYQGQCQAEIKFKVPFSWPYVRLWPSLMWLELTTAPCIWNMQSASGILLIMFYLGITWKQQLC